MRSVLITFILLLTAAAVVVADPNLEKLVVLHRHGARTPLGVSGTTLLCDYPYCELTDEGKDMLRSLGRFLWARYCSSGLLPLPVPYNVSFMASQSTQYSRVVVSAEAMIMGLYEGSEPLPFVDFVPKTDDTALVMWESWPTWKIRSTYDLEAGKIADWVTSFIGGENITALGDAFGVADLCAEDPVDCIGYVQDTIACNVSMGAPVPQWALDRWDDYRTVVSTFLGNMLGYDAADPYDRSVGSLGYPFASEVMSYFADSSSGLMTWRHYAAHDWTLIAVYSALGLWSPSDLGNTTFVPKFAETLLLELWSDDGELYVKGHWGYPDQAPGDHEYSFRLANLTCMSPNGTLYGTMSVANGWCPLAHLHAFVNQTAPDAPEGICFATDDMLSQQGCDDNAAPPIGSRCYFFREKCPAAPCGQVPGAIADPARGYMCQSRQLGKDTPFLAATLVALICPSLLFGAIGGFYFADKLRDVLWRLRGRDGSRDERQPIAKEGGSM